VNVLGCGKSHLYATELELPDDNCRMKSMSCAGHEGIMGRVQAFLTCHAESCATAGGDNFKYFVFEKVYFNPANTRLIENISMCFTSSVNQKGQTMQ
jgi:hypothetical protein